MVVKNKKIKKTTESQRLTQRFRLIVPKNRLPLILTIVFTLIICILAFWGVQKVDSAEVELRLKLNELRFKLKNELEINSLLVDKARISHLSNLVILNSCITEMVSEPTSRNKRTKWMHKTNGPFYLNRADDYWNISLASKPPFLMSIFIDPGAWVKIVPEKAESNQFRISITDGKVLGRIDSADRLYLDCTNCQTNNESNINFTRSKTFRILSQDGVFEFHDLNKSIEITLTLSQTLKENSLPHHLGKNISIDQIDFTRLEGKNLESTVAEDGELYLINLDARKVEIREDDFIELEGLKDVQIKQLYLEDKLNVRIKGNVKELKSGSQSAPYSRLYTNLESLYKNDTLVLFGAAIFTVFSTIVALINLLKTIKEFKRDSQ